MVVKVVGSHVAECVVQALDLDLRIKPVHVCACPNSWKEGEREKGF